MAAPRLYLPDGKMIVPRLGFVKGYIERDYAHEDGPTLKDSVAPAGDLYGPDGREKWRSSGK